MLASGLRCKPELSVSLGVWMVLLLHVGLDQLCVNLDCLSLISRLLCDCEMLYLHSDTITMKL